MGFQAIGSLGRILLDGAKKVKLFGEEISVSATIYNLTGLSAHADKEGLLKWITSFDKKPDKVFVTHGEDAVCDEFVRSLSELGFLAVAPIYMSRYDLSNGEIVSPGIEIEKKASYIQNNDADSFTYSDLHKAYKRLSEVIHRNKHLDNYDLEKFTKEITALTNNWDK